MSACPYCNSPLQEKLNFCIECEKQIKCLQCGEFLFPNKSRCLICGTHIVDMRSENSQTLPVNTYRLKESRDENSYKREVELQITDNAVEKITPVISYFTQIPGNNAGYKQLALSSKEEIVENLEEEIHDKEEDAIEQNEIINHELSKTSITQKEGDLASKLFVKDGDYLKPREADFKGEKKKDQQQRFLLLYVWAYPTIFPGQLPSKQHLLDAAKKLGLLDPNWYPYFDEVSGQYFTHTQDGYQLNFSGEKQANSLLSAIMDENVKGYEYWKPKVSRKRLPVNRDDKTKLEQWRQMPSRGNSFEILSLKDDKDYALFALYDLTKEIKVLSSVKPALAFEYLTSRYEKISVKKDAFRNTLAREYNQKFFRKTDSGEYFLTEEAEKLVESWLVSGRKTN